MYGLNRSKWLWRGEQTILNFVIDLFNKNKLEFVMFIQLILMIILENIKIVMYPNKELIMFRCRLLC